MIRRPPISPPFPYTTLFRSDSGSLPASNAWDNPAIVYQLSGDVTVPAGATLTIAAGQIVKSTGSVNLLVDGTLSAYSATAHAFTLVTFADRMPGSDCNNHDA